MQPSPERLAHHEETLATYGRGFGWRLKYADRPSGVEYVTPTKPHPLAIVAMFCAHIIDRATHTLPNTPLVDSVPYVAALLAGATSHELIDVAVAEERISADDATRVALLDQCAIGTFLAPDNELQRIDGAPTRVKPRTDGTVKGTLAVSVIGQLDELGYVRMTGRECIERANLLMRAEGDAIELLGTEVQSWTEVIRPDNIDRALAFAQLGDSLTGGVPVASLIHKPTRVTYDAPLRDCRTVKVPRDKTIVNDEPKRLRPYSVHTDAIGNSVKRYATRAHIATTKHVAPNGMSTIIGCSRGWVAPAERARKTAQKRSTVSRATLRTMDMAEALQAIEAEMMTAWQTRSVATMAMSIDGVRVSVKCSPDDRSFRVAITRRSPDGKASSQQSRKVRSVGAVVANVRRLAA